MQFTKTLPAGGGCACPGQQPGRNLASEWAASRGEPQLQAQVTVNALSVEVGERGPPCRAGEVQRWTQVSFRVSGI